MLLSQHSRTRQKRGLIDGVGSIANSLFGVLDQKFAEQYRKDIELIRTNQNHMASLWKNQTSIIKSEYDVLKRTESLIDKQHKTITQHLMTLDAATNRMQQEMQYQLDVETFTLTSVIANNMLHNLRNIQDVLSDTIIDIYHGRFNPHLISPEQLKRELSMISSQVPKDLALPVDDIQNELKNIYQLLTVKTRTLQDYCLFEITVPLVSHDLFEVYNLIPIPQQSQNNKITIVPKTAYVGINLKKDLYMTITDMELKDCLHNNEIALCRLQNPINHLTNDKDLCELNYKTHECEIKIKPCSHEWIRMNNINTFIYFCCDACQVRILCEDQVTAQQLSRAGIISLGQGCMIKTRNFTIYSHRQMSNDLKIVPQLDNPYYIPPINHVMNFSMPKPIEDISQPATLDTQEKMKEIHEKIRALQDNQEQFESISYNDVHHYTAIYVLGIIVIVLIGLIVWRWRRHAAPSSRSGGNAGSGDGGEAGAAQGTPVPVARAAFSSKTNRDQCQCNVQSVKSVSECSVRKDEGSSPFVRKPVFKVCEQSA